MKRWLFLSLLGFILFPVFGQETPIGPRWWPSEWGAEDERGAVNRITPEKVAQAARLVQSGQVYSLGRVYESGMPMAGKRHYKLTIPGSPSFPPDGENQIVGHDESVSGEIGQVGTQLDGLGHVGVQLSDDAYFYNGIKLADMADGYGLKKLGVQNVGVFFTRGVLIDVASSKGVDRLKVGDKIGVADLEKALAEQGTQVQPGDVVLIRTGHGKLWMKDNAEYNRGAPGIDRESALWLIQKKVALVGADTWPIEVAPTEDPERPWEIHQWFLVKNGIYLLENLDLEALAGDKVWEFAFIFSPLRLQGATGSPGNPIAVR